mmetsp:Transcript_1382/g.3145  ORF Transcript_1382/g.3145 Transcript_1382/m.3145 type:complete len:375 (+) Transcript_1382:158-1282(+)
MSRLQLRENCRITLRHNHLHPVCNWPGKFKRPSSGATVSLRPASSEFVSIFATSSHIDIKAYRHIDKAFKAIILTFSRGPTSMILRLFLQKGGDFGTKMPHSPLGCCIQHFLGLGQLSDNIVVALRYVALGVVLGVLVERDVGQAQEAAGKLREVGGSHLHRLGLLQEQGHALGEVAQCTVPHLASSLRGVVTSVGDHGALATQPAEGLVDAADLEENIPELVWRQLRHALRRILPYADGSVGVAGQDAIKRLPEVGDARELIDSTAMQVLCKLIPAKMPSVNRRFRLGSLEVLAADSTIALDVGLPALSHGGVVEQLSEGRATRLGLMHENQGSVHANLLIWLGIWQTQEVSNHSHNRIQLSEHLTLAGALLQ